MTELFVNMGFTRNYLLKLKNGYLLLDTSWPRHYKRFLRKIKKLNIKITEIKYLLLSHSHTDHVGFANNVLQDSGAKLIVHENTLPLLSKGIMESEAEPTNRIFRFMFRLAHNVLAANYPGFSIDDKQVIVIKKDKDISIPKEIGLKGKIISTPGHTNDSISLVLDNGNGFVGDLCTNNFMFKSMGLGRKPPLNVGKEIVLASWKKLVDNGVKEIIPAHGKPFPIEKLDL